MINLQRNPGHWQKSTSGQYPNWEPRLSKSWL